MLFIREKATPMDLLSRILAEKLPLFSGKQNNLKSKVTKAGLYLRDSSSFCVFRCCVKRRKVLQYLIRVLKSIDFGSNST